MNPFRAPAAGLSEPPKFLAQFESQALERLGTGLFPDGDSPIQKTVVIICACHGYGPEGFSDGLASRFFGSILKRMLSRNLMALSVNRAALSDAVCAKSAEAPVEAKPHISIRGNPFPLIKPPILGGLNIAVNG